MTQANTENSSARVRRCCAPDRRRSVRSDSRWPQIEARLLALRECGRCALRVVDADCGCGGMLIETLRLARGLGFTAIEGCGIDISPARIGRAKAAAASIHDPAIGVEFASDNVLARLAREASFPADLVLCHCSVGESSTDPVGTAIAAAGVCVICDQPSHLSSVARA